MGNIADKAIVLGIMVFIGFLITVLFRKLHINIKHPIRFSLILWCIGMGIIYLGYKVYEEDVLSPMSNYFFVIGAIPLIIGSSFCFCTIYNSPPRNKPLKTSKTEKFVTSITKWTLRKIYGGKRY
jgi:hypothetical protein